MTFEEFTATRTESADIREIAQLYPEDGYEKPIPGLVYADDFYIEKEPDGRYHLVLGNRDWLTHDLAELERRLFDYVQCEL